MAQSSLVARAVTAATGLGVELVPIKTRGDLITDRPLELVGGKGVFTKEIEQALLAGQVDFAVHSMKDLPGEIPDGLTIAAVPEREDSRDVLVGGRLRELAAGSVVGTGSARRRLQILDLRPDLEISGIRGNVETRIGRQRHGDFAAVVLAAAGLARLGRSGEADDTLSVEDVTPAPGQGALAIQCRTADRAVVEALQTISHGSSSVCVAAERAFLIALSGGCSVPAACHARLLPNEELLVIGFFAHGGSSRRDQVRGAPEDACRLGRELAIRLQR
jgi:hydroxymethylbilane synthase